MILHNHQPVGNFAEVMESAYQDSYLPFIEIFESYADLRLALHTSGSLMEWLDEHHPEYLDRLAAHVSEQKTRWNNPGHRGQREPPKMQLAQTCGVTDHIEGQKRQQATAEDQEGQSVLRSEQACVNLLTEMTLNEGTTETAGQTKSGKRTEFRAKNDKECPERVPISRSGGECDRRRGQGACDDSDCHKRHDNNWSGKTCRLDPAVNFRAIRQANVNAKDVREGQCDDSHQEHRNKKDAHHHGSKHGIEQNEERRCQKVKGHAEWNIPVRNPGETIRIVV